MTLDSPPRRRRFTGLWERAQLDRSLTLFHPKWRKGDLQLLFPPLKREGRIDRSEATVDPGRDHAAGDPHPSRAQSSERRYARDECTAAGSRRMPFQASDERPVFGRADVPIRVANRES